MRGLWRSKHANGKPTGGFLRLARFRCGWPRLFGASLLEKRV